MPLIRTCTHCGQKNRVPASHLADTGRCGGCKGELAPVDQPIAADTALFYEIVKGARVPILVDFWADWCGPCRMAAPEVAQTAANTSGRALVLKVDTEQNRELSARYNVRGIPNFAVFHGGSMVSQQAGLVGHEEMERWLDAAHEG